MPEMCRIFILAQRRYRYPQRRSCSRPSRRSRISWSRGPHDLFNSERYREYLATMAKFRNYSPYNSILISMQKPDGCRSKCRSKCRCKRRSSGSSTCKVDAGSHLIASGFPRWRMRKAKKKVEVKTVIQNA